MNILGITNGECEHFVKDNQLITICNGKIYYDLEMPKLIFDLRKKELRNDIDAQQSLYRMEVTELNEMILQFCKCRYGGYDDTADTIIHKKSTPDYWNCGKRGVCKKEFCLCRPVITENGQLSRKEIEVIKLIAQDLADKQIAEILQVGENTIHTHRYHITKKIGCSSKNGIVAFAYEKGIINK